MLLAASAALTLALSAPAFAHDYKAGEIVIDHPWTRATPPNAPVAGGYLTLDNRGSSEDRLLGGSSPVASDVQIHEMSMDDGVMKMRQITDGLAVPAGEAVELSPGGYHLMLMDLSEPLKEGARVPLTLRFEKAGDVEVELAVEAMGAKAPQGESHEMHHGAAHGDTDMPGHEGMAEKSAQ
ncbi:copper chaperone PCu(A)C [Fulvimarina endophytica]|uniref:Copper chaperone PCu(A)C n=2 Tax=Fulvimarina endophytica TaxID=2293836 RepID=A0A371X7U2_9HYPH|nr:copper chaperone PCu(A)C [Fulvimarina endophytica]